MDGLSLPRQLLPTWQEVGIISSNVCPAVVCRCYILYTENASLQFHPENFKSCPCLSKMSLCDHSFKHIWAIEDTKAYKLPEQLVQKTVKFSFCQVKISHSQTKIYSLYRQWLFWASPTFRALQWVHVILITTPWDRYLVLLSYWTDEVGYYPTWQMKKLKNWKIN